MWLSIDTSGARTFVAFGHLRGAGMVFEEICDPTPSQVSTDPQAASASHSGSLASLVQSALEDLSIQPSSIQGIVIGAGPGSFTGLRIGYSFAKGLALSLSIPLFPISSLAAAAWEFRSSQPCQVLALDDARRDEFFAASFNLSNSSIHCDLKEQILNVDKILKWQSEHPEGILVSANPEVLMRFPNTKLCNSLACSLGNLYHANLLELTKVAEVFETPVQQLSALAPAYLRKVAAKTIVERNQ